MVEVALSFLPRSHNPSPGQQLEPRHQRKHGRQYSIQLDIGDKPVQHADSDSEAEGKSLSATAAHFHSSSFASPEASSLGENTRGNQDGEPVHSVFHPTPSPEEIFARRFGYGAPAHQPVLSTEFHDQPVALFSRPRPRSQRRLTPFSDEEEGNLVVLPSPPLLRPASFWRNTRRSALHTSSLHLVRRATFLAAGLSLDKPVCDLSAFAVESRVTVGRTRGLGGSAGVPVGWSVSG